MILTKRNFLKASGAALASLSVAKAAFAQTHASSVSGKNSALKNITQNVSAITTQERKQRIKKAQQLMQQANISALILEPGPAMDYFSGIQWWRSERVTALIIPREGEVAVVCPFFEEPSIRETLAVSDDIRVWQEHESPFKLIKQILDEKGITKKATNNNIAFEFSVRYFVLRGVMDLIPTINHVSADPITQGCRIIKSQHELELMHKANEITLTAYADVWSQLAIGMNGSDIKSLMANAQSALGGKGAWNMALINQASAYPHGTKQKQTIKEGSIVLMDCGCNVHGYQSDISRTFVVGEPSKKQQQIWNTVRKGQQIAFEQAQIGTEAGKVDDAVRAYYQTQGLGPDYKLPGLSHRTGHGIGMKGHEGINFVHGEKGKLRAGMCFSNEPGIYIPGAFGVRLEDCIYLTDKGPRWFTNPANSLEDPIGSVAKL
jgi:Xaa-Pro dipeptidase